MKLLFELFTEELPASEMKGLDQRMADNISEILKGENIIFSNLKSYVTPRRMAIKFEFDKYIKSEDKKIIGPPESICYKDAKPTKALMGFLRKNGATEEDIIIEENKKGRYVSLIIKQEDRSAKELMGNILNNFIINLHFNKKMRWGDGDYAFIRPVHNITFMIDNEVIDFNFAGINSTSYTYGHRFLNPQKVKLSYDNYESALEDAFVIVDQNRRRDIILNKLESICKKENLSVVYDDELLNEVVNLCEYPVVVVGEFEDKFIHLPKEVLITSMKDHQRYFAFTKNGKLINKFAAVSNIETDNMQLIKEGYERVLRARFDDAEFFYAEDSKKKLVDFVDGLKKMTFHDKLGSQYDRVMRLVKLSAFLAEKLKVNVDYAKRAAYLSKADLLTQMVYEFPELQGVMGREYAKLSGESDKVANAIYEQYLPKDEENVSSETGMVLSLADKIDLIVGGFIADLKPTGNKDPYALRRAALGIIKIVTDFNIALNLSEAILYAAKLYNKNIDLEGVLEFIKVRFFNYCNQYPYDILMAVTQVSFDDIADVNNRLLALNYFILHDPDKKKRFAIKRVFNIVPENYESTFIDEGLFESDYEKKLLIGINSIESEYIRRLEKKDYKEAINMVDRIVPDINMFFDNVMVMDKDENIKNNRLSLLNRLRLLVLRIANFKFLEI